MELTLQFRYTKAARQKTLQVLSQANNIKVSDIYTLVDS